MPMYVLFGTERTSVFFWRLGTRGRGPRPRERTQFNDSSSATPSRFELLEDHGAGVLGPTDV